MKVVVLSRNKLRLTEADFVSVDHDPLRRLNLWARRPGHKPLLVGAFEVWDFAYPQRPPSPIATVEEAAEALDLVLKDCNPDVWPRLRFLVMKMTDAVRANRVSVDE